MGERYLYDAVGRYIGKSSDRPPVSNCGCYGILFCVTMVVVIINTVIAIVHPPPDLTPQLLGRWKNDRGGFVIQYAPDHSYTATEVKGGKTVEQGTWRLDDKTLFYQINADSPRNAKESGSHHINSLDGKALVMDQETIRNMDGTISVMSQATLEKIEAAK